MLVDITWQPAAADVQPAPADLPLLALVGKGVCFDTGGLNLKTTAGMRVMKKVRAPCLAWGQGAPLDVACAL